MLILCGSTYVLFCLLVFFLQRSLLYFPTHEPHADRLVPWVVDDQAIGYRQEVSSPQAVWLVMHGNGGQASDRAYVLECMSAQDSLFVLEYPGYGVRPGSPSRRSIDAAAQHAYGILRAGHPGIPVCVVGESIGSGPASMLALERQPPDKIVLITPFDTLHRVAAKRFFFLPVWLLLLDRWNNIDALSNYRGPIEIFAAADDTIIPAVHARTLAESSVYARFHLIPGGHNDWSLSNSVKIENQ
jgi:pimeloyl-ACP methyl ester carboxylesterase